MTTSPDFKSIERAFYSDGYRLGMKAAENFQSKNIFSEAIQELHQLIDDLIHSFSEFAIQQNQTIDCKKGCEWCCHQPVFALDYELFHLNKFLKENFSAEKQDEIREKAIQKNKKLTVLPEDQLLNAKHPCPLLENGACIAYQARPVACRIYLSKNVNSCIRFYNNPEDKTSFPELLDLPMRVGRMANEGFKAALKTKGIQPLEYRIEERLI